jgi:hypothetical protein
MVGPERLNAPLIYAASGAQMRVDQRLIFPGTDKLAACRTSHVLFLARVL